MADVISIDEKLALAKEKREALVRRRKIEAVRKVLQCTQCAFKCEKCGTQLRPGTEAGGGGEDRSYRIPYRLCESCRDEYVDYIARHQGGGDPDCYWHNDAWRELWRCWIEYQGAIDRYTKSKEFQELLKELKQNRPDE